MTNQEDRTRLQNPVAVKKALGVIVSLRYGFLGLINLNSDKYILLFSSL